MDELLQMIYPDASEYVDWHTLLVTLAQPYPIPLTQDLLNALNSYRTITNGDVLMRRDQYDKVYTVPHITVNGALENSIHVKICTSVYFCFISIHIAIS